VAKRQTDGRLVKPGRHADEPGRTVPEPPPDRRPVAAGEINRELTILKRMFSLAMQAGKLRYKPHIPMLRENNVRIGFFELEQHLELLKHLPEAFRPVVRFAYVTGWRINSEVLPLQWRQIDLKRGEVRLDPGTTKNREGRVFYYSAELRELLEDQRKLADRLQRELGRIVPDVFFHVVQMKDGRLGKKSGAPIAESGFITPGAGHGPRQAVRRASRTTFVGRQSATWSVPISRSGWRRN
jgi:integrase